jgi:hypothetical protein
LAVGHVLRVTLSTRISATQYGNLRRIEAIDWQEGGPCARGVCAGDLGGMVGMVGDRNKCPKSSKPVLESLHPRIASDEQPFRGRARAMVYWRFVRVQSDFCVASPCLVIFDFCLRGSRASLCSSRGCYECREGPPAVDGRRTSNLGGHHRRPRDLKGKLSASDAWRLGNATRSGHVRVSRIFIA